MKKKKQFPFLATIQILAILLAACSTVSEDTGTITDPIQDSGTGVMDMDGEDVMTEAAPTQPDEDSVADPMSTAMDEEMTMFEDMGDDMKDQNNDMDGHNDEAMMAVGDNEKVMVEDEMANDAETGENSTSTAAGGMMTPQWFEIDLVEARTGETFTIADFKGKVVLVETLAMWCSNCFKQQGEIKTLHETLGERSDFISLGIDIDPNENVEALKNLLTTMDSSGITPWRPGKLPGRLGSCTETSSLTQLPPLC